MQGILPNPFFICARCLRARLPQQTQPWRRYNAGRQKSDRSPHATMSGEPPTQHDVAQEQGAMSRRLAEMSEESLETGGHSARKAVAEAGFSEELRKRLEEKIASASFRSENAAAIAQANLPTSASKHIRDIAGAQPWTGAESVADASLRMLNDAHKPLRGPPRTPSVRSPSTIDTGRPKGQSGTGVRLANARDRSSVYSVLNDPGMSDAEREKYREELKARFQPGSRSIPATVQGLQSLANKRIEDAIARGQFKNLPRGKEIERDYNASNPFIDTTEYFLNKMIQKQEILPPWVEKQQELVLTMNRFRSRLRADWKRHVARTISSRGGSLEDQIKLAEEYAYAERLANPTKKQLETLHASDAEGHLSQITISGDLSLETSNNSTGRPETTVDVVEQVVKENGTLAEPTVEVRITTDPTSSSAPPPSPQPSDLVTDEASTVTAPQSPPRTATVPPFRDAEWFRTEEAYLTAAIANLNTLTRSYNLMAPDLAKKTYFSLDRELRACYADVAPQIADVIRERAARPKIRGVEVVGHKPGGVLEKFSMDAAVNVYDERKPQYGFKEFWRDLFASGKS